MNWENFFSEEKGKDWITISRKDNQETVLAVCSGCVRVYASPLLGLAVEEQMSATQYLGSCVPSDIVAGNILVFGVTHQADETKFRQAFESGFRERNRNA